MFLQRAIIPLLSSVLLATAAIDHGRQSLALRDKVSSNVLSLRKVKSRFTNDERISRLASRHPGKVATLSKRHTDTYSTHITDNHDIDFIASVKFEGKPYDVWVDTGSSEFWLVKENFVCTDPETLKPTEQDVCKMGPGTKSSFADGPIFNTNFNATYAIEWYVNGEAGYTDLDIAGLTVKNQTVGLIDRMYWGGDGVSSGLLGLEGFQEALYSGTVFANDNKSNMIDHPTLTTNMWKSNLTPPIIGFAQERHSSNGWLSFGGIPPVNVSNTYVTAPLPQTKNAFYSYTSYFNIFVEGISYAPASQGNKTRVLIPSADKITSKVSRAVTQSGDVNFIPVNSSVTIDNGSNYSGFPTKIINQLAQAYEPPATFNETILRFTVPCDATPPEVGLKLSNGVIEFQAVDLIYQNIRYGNYCLCGLQGIEVPGIPNWILLGDSFLNGVVSVFDYEKQEARFAKHIY